MQAPKADEIRILRIEKYYSGIATANRYQWDFRMACGRLITGICPSIEKCRWACLQGLVLTLDVPREIHHIENGVVVKKEKFEVTEDERREFFKKEGAVHGKRNL